MYGSDTILPTESAAGHSIPVVHTLRVRVDWVRFPVSRPKEKPWLNAKAFLIDKHYQRLEVLLATDCPHMYQNHVR